MITKIKNKNVTFFNLENVQYNMNFYQLILKFTAQSDTEKMNLSKETKINKQELNAINKIIDKPKQLKNTDIQIIKTFINKNKNLFN